MQFRAAFERLAAFPHIGHRSERLPFGSCRIWNVFDYLVIYNAETHPLEIVRVIHGARGEDVLADDA
ncbi:MAG: type II toxin-antitoxin system RelE/ParE family toxin [Phycisphaerales bacterium]|nr:type II toxin-antitoxin system RelE/ParE family toxin [Phycisphaerales bacterium]